MWLPTLFLITALLLHLHHADAQLARTMRHFCSGSSNGLAILGTTDRYEDLRRIYQNCTRVFGNIEITYLNQGQIGNRTFDFFDDIEEVKGYILIFNTGGIERISFKKLRIIGGDNLYGTDQAALHIQRAFNLKVVSMPNLRSIEKGVVQVISRYLCHMQFTVNPDEFLDFDRKRYLPEKFSTETRLENCNGLMRKAACHPLCNGACWGPDKEDCQIVYRSTCPANHCESRQCFEDKATTQTRCCHPQCTAGCTGPSATDCLACSNFRQCKDADLPTQECKCVEKCTRLRKYNPKTGQVEVNPDGFYSLDNQYCVKQCPVTRLVQDDVCVEHCGPGMHYDPTKGDKICRQCDGLCPKTCKFEEYLHADNIKKLINCTEIEGFLHMNKATFQGSELPRAKDEPKDIMKMRRGLRIEELNVLKSVRFISEYLYMAVEDSNVRSMDFLENLEFIEGRSLFGGRQSLIISHNENLQHLGLRKLKKIGNGDVLISMNYDLCYLDSLNWKDIVTGANATIGIAQNRHKSACKSENKECHLSCDPALGCWGPSSGDCRFNQIDKNKDGFIQPVEFEKTLEV